MFESTDKVIRKIQRSLTPTEELMDTYELRDINGHFMREQPSAMARPGFLGGSISSLSIGGVNYPVGGFKFPVDLPPSPPASRASVIIADDMEVAITAEDMKQSFHDMAHVTAQQVADQINKSAGDLSCSVDQKGVVIVGMSQRGTARKAEQVDSIDEYIKRFKILGDKF